MKPQGQELRSHTINQLIAQTDHLTAQLSQAMKKMALLESEQAKLREEKEYYQYKVSQLTDQSQLIAEKDNIWLGRLEKLEKQKIFVTEKAKMCEEKMSKLRNEVARLRRFHGRIQKVVAPYIEELKRYSKDLEIKISESARENTQLVKKNMGLQDRILQIARSYSEEKEHIEDLHTRTIEEYERELEALKSERQEVKILKKELTSKETALLQVKDRNDVLENSVVSLKNELTTLQEQTQQAKSRQDAEAQLTRTQISDFEAQLAQIKFQLETATSKNDSLENQYRMQTSQLESLRMLYSEKISECDKKTMALAALEKLNSDLAQKLQSFYSDTADSNPPRVEHSPSP